MTDYSGSAAGPSSAFPLHPSPGSSLGVGLHVEETSFNGRPLFQRLDLDLEPGAWTCLLGPSGVGKTTLLRLIAGLDPTDSRHIVTARDGLPLAGRVAYMAQQDLLLPWLDVLGNVTLGARLRGEAPDLPRARSLLAAASLGGMEAAPAGTLSGGQRQRVALVRTLMEDRPLVLMDEPFSALDTPTRLRLQETAARLLAGRTVLLVTHDPLEALRLGHRVLVLAGRPARLSALPVPPTPPPRAAADPEVLQAQGALLDRLAQAAEEDGPCDA